MCSTQLPSTAESEKKDETSEERRIDHEKKEEKQRVAVSEKRERSWGDLRKKKKKGCHGSPTDEQQRDEKGRCNAS